MRKKFASILNIALFFECVNINYLYELLYYSDFILEYRFYSFFSNQTGCPTGKALK